MTAILEIAANGNCQCLHTDLIPLQELGRLSVRRASMVEFNEEIQQWEVRHATRRVQLSVFPPITRAVVMARNPSRQWCLDWEQCHFQELL
jgi:acetyl-CoA carboxylase alpha subunit